MGRRSNMKCEMQTKVHHHHLTSREYDSAILEVKVGSLVGSNGLLATCFRACQSC